MQDGFPQLLLYFKLVLAFAVSSASCERSFSALKRIKFHLRSTMGENRTSALSLPSIERDLTDGVTENVDMVIDRFAEVGNRRSSSIQ